MSKQWHGGKGSQRRNSNEKAYADNWEKIFGKTSRGGAKPTKDKNKNV
jgi:hypothetical protein